MWINSIEYIQKGCNLQNADQFTSKFRIISSQVQATCIKLSQRIDWYNPNSDAVWLYHYHLTHWSLVTPCYVIYLGHSDPGNGLLHDNIKILPEPVLTPSVKSCDIHLMAISLSMLKIPITKGVVKSHIQNNPHIFAWTMINKLTHASVLHSDHPPPGTPLTGTPFIKMVSFKSQHGLMITSIYKVRNIITYPFPNFNGYTVEVCECISNFIPHYVIDMIT